MHIHPEGAYFLSACSDQIKPDQHMLSSLFNEYSLDGWMVPQRLDLSIIFIILLVVLLNLTAGLVKSFFAIY